jgi:ubiquinone/menaquinone biosynthesis C-methylase UbiE
MAEDAPSITFDRAAEYYDRTRQLTDDARGATTDLLRAEIGGRGRCLEIGVGTGLVALPLHEAGVRVVGLDLSEPMLRKLIEKAGGRRPFPVVLGDALRLPFADDAFVAAIARHVLHLIADWRVAVAELVRVVRPGGLLLLDIGVSGGPWQEVSDHLEAQVGSAAHRIGLRPEGHGELDAAIRALGGSSRQLPVVWESSDLTVDRYLREVEEALYSWTWRIPPDVLSDAVEGTRRWARDRFGSLQEVLEPRVPIAWRAYDLHRR